MSRCWGDVGPASQTVDQHYIGIGSAALIGWDRLPAELILLSMFVYRCTGEPQSSTLSRHYTDAQRVRDIDIVLGLVLDYCGPTPTQNRHLLNIVSVSRAR